MAGLRLSPATAVGYEQGQSFVTGSSLHKKSSWMSGHHCVFDFQYDRAVG